MSYIILITPYALSNTLHAAAAFTFKCKLSVFESIALDLRPPKFGST
jgi:hypothetical protein